MMANIVPINMHHGHSAFLSLAGSWPEIDNADFHFNFQKPTLYSRLDSNIFRPILDNGGKIRLILNVKLTSLTNFPKKYEYFSSHFIHVAL